MNRILNLKQSTIRKILSWFFLIFLIIIANKTINSQNTESFIIRPYLQFSTQTSMHILWLTYTNATTKVEYGQATQNASVVNLNQFEILHDRRKLHEVHRPKQGKLYWLKANIR